MKTLCTDKRYTINLEFCGQKEQKHVVRFCGDWLGAYDTVKAAQIAVFEFHANRLATGHNEIRQIIAESNDIQLYKGHMFTVVYGARVKNYHMLSEATKEFAECLEHSLNCQGFNH